MYSKDQMYEFVSRLKSIRDTYGDDAWREAIKTFAKQCVGDPGSEVFAKSFVEELSDPLLVWENIVTEAKNEAQPKSAEMNEGAFMRALQAQLPALKSQGQFTAFQGTFEAFRAVCNAIMSKDKVAEETAKEALSKGFETLRMATDITQKLHDVPEAATSAAAEEFKRPPAEFGEYDIQRTLLTELQAIHTLSGLDEWWVTNRKRIDDVKSPSLRNPLIDLVREKKAALGKGAQA